MFRCLLVPVSQQLVGGGGGGVIRVLENPIFKQTRPKPELPNQFAISHPLPPPPDRDRQGGFEIFVYVGYSPTFAENDFDSLL